MVVQNECRIAQQIDDDLPIQVQVNVCNHAITCETTRTPYPNNPDVAAGPNGGLEGLSFVPHDDLPPRLVI